MPQISFAGWSNGTQKRRLVRRISVRNKHLCAFLVKTEVEPRFLEKFGSTPFVPFITSRSLQCAFVNLSAYRKEHSERTNLQVRPTAFKSNIDRCIGLYLKYSFAFGRCYVAVLY